MIEMKVILIVFGAVIAFLFWLIEYKISKMEKLSEQRYSEQINMRIAERELLMAEASISALTAKCVRGEHDYCKAYEVCKNCRFEQICQDAGQSFEPDLWTL